MYIKSVSSPSVVIQITSTSKFFIFIVLYIFLLQFKSSPAIIKFDFTGLNKIAEKILNKPVYFTLDLDVLDPSCFPGTGTPEAGGVSFTELMSAIKSVSALNVVGIDVNELSPMLDQSGASTALACKLLREILLYFYKEK